MDSLCDLRARAKASMHVTDDMSACTCVCVRDDLGLGLGLGLELSQIEGAALPY